MVFVCKCVTHSLPFNWLLRLYSFFPLTLLYLIFPILSAFRLPRLAISYWAIPFKQIKVQYNTSFRYHFSSSVREQYMHGLRSVLRQLWHSFPTGAFLPLFASFCSSRSSCSSCSSRADHALDALPATPSCHFLLKSSVSLSSSRALRVF